MINFVKEEKLISKSVKYLVLKVHLKSVFSYVVLVDQINNYYPVFITCMVVE